jgi:hypothetical protein
MDKPNLQQNSTASNQKRKAEEESTIVSSKRSRFYESYHQQTFPLPDTIMHYITKYPKSPNGYQKLVKSCKHFFAENPIIIFSHLLFYSIRWTTYSNDVPKDVNLKNVSSKFWITKWFLVSTHDDATNFNVLSSIVPKIYKSEAEWLTITNQHITFNELLFLSSNVKDLVLKRSSVKYENGSIVPVEKIFEIFEKIKEFTLTFKPELQSGITFKTFNELLKIPQFFTLDMFELKNIPEDFDIESCYSYLKKNKTTLFRLGLSY